MRSTERQLQVGGGVPIERRRAVMYVNPFSPAGTTEWAVGVITLEGESDPQARMLISLGPGMVPSLGARRSALAEMGYQLAGTPWEWVETPLYTVSLDSMGESDDFRVGFTDDFRPGELIGQAYVVPLAGTEGTDHGDERRDALLPALD